MATTELILIQQICNCHDIEFTFMNDLNELGLIEIYTVEDYKYIHEDQLKDVEKMIRMHRELNINLEGIDAIYNLQQRIDQLEQELTQSQNRLKAFNIETKNQSHGKI